MALLLPTGSVKNFQKYARRLLYRGKKSHSVVTKFTLKRMINKTGIAYAQVNFSALRDLQKNEILNIQKLMNKMKDLALEVRGDGLQSSNENLGN
jgi:L-arabinose isomerase